MAFFSETFLSTRRRDNGVNEDFLNDFIHNSHSLLLQAHINKDNVLLFNTKVKINLNLKQTVITL